MKYKFAPISLAILLSCQVNASATDRLYEHRWLDPNGDPYLSLQWNLLNDGSLDNTVAGHDLNLWQSHLWGHKGQGVQISLIDTGVDELHSDLIDNLIFDPSIDSTEPWASAHGTYMAGLIAAVQNDVGIRGVAPEAEVIVHNRLGSYMSRHEQWAYHRGIGLQNGKTSIAQNSRVFNTSFGVTPVHSTPYNYAYTTTDADTGEAIQMVNFRLRDEVMERITLSTEQDKRTALFVQAAGNGYYQTLINAYGPNGIDTPGYHHAINNGGLPFHNANSGHLTSFWKINVSGVSADGRLTNSSTVGSNIFVTAPAGADRNTPGMVTTTLSCDWHQKYQGQQQVCTGPQDYYFRVNGTSSAAANVTGAVALLMSAAEQQGHNLTARDIRHLLANTATKVNRDMEDIKLSNVVALEGWSSNAAGVEFSPYYGFGLVDVDKAAELIRRYAVENLPANFVKTQWFGEHDTFSKPILEDITHTTTSEIEVTEDMFIEGVQVRLSAEHGRITDLKVELESPSGTRSILMSPNNNLVGQNTDYIAPSEKSLLGYDDHKLLSYKFWDERSVGTWKLHITDMNDQQRTIVTDPFGQPRSRYTIENNTKPGTFTNWSIRVLGHTDKVTKKKNLN
ncbi:S8 family serine peptidase [Pseudoalteromonas luteoviolacea]|uniref:S8 family serine peptidase n=1 Tax=Pseudoalteromonas luteoviolacea TaxID=43657 RepID=UPI001B39F371|nr:S8 family serine peptidase [Pseudoalteromonas luteoviolacea]MBQ4876370.1 S8 family serine peptidase [Pseudoalteromonas luteoviolacea]MBQ4905000.1 S8 family serine peptidase [Pseudoalteromonas luteoviolacea]